MELTKKSALTVASAEPIRDLLKAVVDEADGRRKYLGRKVTSQALINGLVIWLGKLPAEERAEKVDQALWSIGMQESGQTPDSFVVELKDAIENAPKPKGKRKAT